MPNDFDKPLIYKKFVKVEGSLLKIETTEIAYLSLSPWNYINKLFVTASSVLPILFHVYSEFRMLWNFCFYICQRCYLYFRYKLIIEMTDISSSSLKEYKNSLFIASECHASERKNTYFAFDRFIWYMSRHNDFTDCIYHMVLVKKYQTI